MRFLGTDPNQDGGGRGIGGFLKNGELAVPLISRPVQETAAACHCLLDQLIMAGDSSCRFLRRCFPEPGTAFNIGEKEGYGACWKIYWGHWRAVRWIISVASNAKLHSDITLSRVRHLMKIYCQ